MKSFFGQPGIFLAWGLKNGDWTPEAGADRIADAGFKWAAQEYGDPATEPDPDRVKRFRARCHERGLYFGIWEVQPRDLSRVAAVVPNFWILNVESDHFDYEPLLAAFRAQHKALPAGVVTNCDLDQRPFIAHNIKAIPEAYVGANPEATPANMVARCKQMGWRVVFPALGVYDGFPLSGYTRAGNGYSVYLAEGMTPDDLKTAHAWNK